MSIVYLGIDPGKSGAICTVDILGFPDTLVKLNKEPSEIWDKLSNISIDRKCIAAIELVNAMPGQGVSSTFKFGESFGMLVGLLTASGIPFDKVRPAVWCKAMGLKRKEKESNTSWKNRHKQLAKKLFPIILNTDRTCLALKSS